MQLQLFGKKYGFAKNHTCYEVCYGLIDMILTRPFCIMISWSGPARSANVEKKINFSANKKIIEAFSKVVTAASSDATDIAIQGFFSNTVFRNASARLHHKKYRSEKIIQQPKQKRRRNNEHNENEQQNQNQEGQQNAEGQGHAQSQGHTEGQGHAEGQGHQEGDQQVHDAVDQQLDLDVPLLENSDIE